MATIRTAISLYDGVSGPLRTMHRAMNVVMDSFEALNTASSGAIDVSSIRQARAELSGVMSDFSRTEEQIRNADDAQNELNSSIRGGSSAADTLLGRFKSLVATVGGLAAIKKVVGLSDELASTKARLNLIVDQQEPVPQLADASVHVGLDVDDSQLTDKLANTDARIGVTVDDGGSVEELERKIMASAQRSRAAYFDTASAVASMGANAKAAFSSNDELISFIEQVNKQFVIGGADAQGQAAAMLQLKQAMGMGVLRGEELNSVLENAPGIARIIEQYMGIAEGSIKSYAEKGAVTAEVVKDALLGAADETNAAFESMPMTWGQIWTSMQNKALSIFSPILQRINDIANTDKFSAVTDGLLDGLAAAAKAGTVTLDVLLSIASAFIDNWGIIQPLIFGIAAAMLLYNGYLLTNNALTAISNIQKGIAAVQAYKAAAANAALSASEQAAAMSTASATAAQYGFNAALLSCPLTWVIVGIIAVVAAIYLIVAAINNMTGSAISATGIICGIFAVAASLILNTGIGVYNSFLAIIGTFVNFFLGIIEWVLNAANGGFDSFGGAVANLIGQIISWFLSLGQVVTTIIDAIFGTNWTAGLEDLKGTVTQWGKNDTAITLDRGDYSGIQRIQYSDAWDAGYSFGQSVDSKVSGLFDGFSMDSMGAFNFGNTLERIEQNSGFTAANTAASSKKLDITSEELKYLRDIAEREAINRFTTAEVRIEQTNHNSISKDVDVDGIMDYWADWFAEKLDVSYEGVHG